jgi:hypothetical protein
MPGLPWTKFQDFYLRLGCLKVLVAALSPQRRSEASETIYRRLRTPLLRPATEYPSLLARAKEALPPGVTFPAASKTEPMTVAEAILVADRSPSWLLAITDKTAFKILDWGHDVRFVGPGNQITERGLILRSLIPDTASSRFLAGDPEAWNPFELTYPERLFLSYHLFEIDQLSYEIVRNLSEFMPGDNIDSAKAAELTCRSFFRVLDRAKPALLPRDLPSFRTAQELACTIARELKLKDLMERCGAVSPRVPKLKTFSAGASTRMRQTTKNADHQTVPRFEQLVDLGFAEKPSDMQSETPSYRTLPQRRWRYRPTARCKVWYEAAARQSGSDPRWLWSGFATAAVASGQCDGSAQRKLVDLKTTARLLADAYWRIRRPIGHTPFESVALLAMIFGASEGYAIEMRAFHDIVISVKQRNLLPDAAFFASGNELDKMFVLFKPSFEQNLLELLDQLPSRGAGGEGRA